MLGRGVDNSDPRHAEVIARFEEPRKILETWVKRGLVSAVPDKEFEQMLQAIECNEEACKDFYWCSSTAECPDDSWLVRGD